MCALTLKEHGDRFDYMAKRILSLRDVAREAGVHFTTVSLALRDDPRLPIATRERIQELARKLGYHRNPLVSSVISNMKRSLIPQELGAIGFLDILSRPSGPGRRSPNGHPFYEGALRRAGELGYQIDLLQINSSGMTARRMKSILKARSIRGLIIDSHLHARGHLSLDISHMACVMRGYSNLRPNLHRVSHNHFQGILAAIHFLRHMGYHRIGLCLEEKLDKVVNNQWSAGYLVWQQQLPASKRIPIQFYRALSPAILKKWIERYRPEVVLGLSEVYTVLAKCGLSIPEEICFANLDIDASPDTGQAGIWQNMEMIGSTAVDALTAQMQRNEFGLPSHPKLLLLEGIWRNGWTVCAKQSDHSASC